MPAAKHDFVIEQGTDWEWSLRWKDPTVNLSGYSFALQARSDLTSTTKVINLSSPSSGITVNTATRTISVAMVPTATAALTFTAPLIYNLEMTSNLSKVSRLMEGTITLSEEAVK
jgi:hypothetical protein